MKVAPLPEDEADRLAALRALDVLDTPAEPALDDIVKIVSELCKVPIALISLVDAERQWFKAKVGIDAAETSRDLAFCAHAILQPDLFVVPDTHQDPRFADNPFVTGAPNVRFYAGAPLRLPDGHPIGTLCAIDSVPRTLSPDARAALEALKRQAEVHFALRAQASALKRLHAERDVLARLVAHDIRGALSTLILCAGELDDETTPAPILTDIREATGKLEHLVADLVELGVTNEGARVERVAVDLDTDPLIREVVQSVSARGAVITLRGMSLPVEMDRRFSRRAIEVVLDLATLRGIPGVPIAITLERTATAGVVDITFHDDGDATVEKGAGVALPRLAMRVQLGHLDVVRRDIDTLSIRLAWPLQNAP